MWAVTLNLIAEKVKSRRVTRFAEVAIADLGHGHDDGGVRSDGLLQLAAETRHVRVDGAAVELEIDAVVPDAGGQLVARNRALLVAEEVHQQVELFRREFQLLIFRGCFACGWDELD